MYLTAAVKWKLQNVLYHEIETGKVFFVLIAIQTLLPYLSNKHSSITVKLDIRGDLFQREWNTFLEIHWQDVDKFLFNENHSGN